MKSMGRRAFVAGTAGGLAVLVLTAAGVSARASADGSEQAGKLLAAVPPHGERVLGNANAPVVMIEYASATCPHCAEFHADVLPEIKKTYIDTGKVKLIFREFPLDDRAMAVFMLTRCLPEDRYFPTLDALFRQQKEWTGSNPKAPLMKIMQDAGMTEAEFDACLKRRDLAEAIFDTRKIANEQFGVKGTPTFFINGKIVDGHKDASDVATAIEAALKEQQ